MDTLEQAKLALDLAEGGGTFRIDYFHEAQASALIGILEELRKMNERAELEIALQETREQLEYDRKAR